jgi:hypothetical protein
MSETRELSVFTHLRQSLTERFDDNELRSLCFDLRIDYDSLGGEGKAGKAREILAYLDRHERIPELINIVRRQRPDVFGDDVSQEAERALSKTPYTFSRRLQGGFERIRRGINIYVVACAVVVSLLCGAVVAFSIAEYIYSQKINAIDTMHSLELERIQSRLASIRRRLGEKEFFDVTNLIVSQGMTVSKVPSSAKYFQSDGFYAMQGESHWVYSQVSEYEFIKLIYPSFTDLPPSFPVLPLHLWRGENVASGEGLGFGVGEVTRLFPYIIVERIPYERFGEIIGWARSTELTMENAVLEKGLSSEQLIAQLERIFRGDAAGSILSSLLMQQFVTQAIVKNVQVDLVEIQKVGNTVYVQILIITKDVEVDQTHYSSYYQRNELLLVSTKDSVYLVQTSVPSQDPLPRDEYFQWVTEWLSNFAIVIP